MNNGIVNTSGEGRTERSFVILNQVDFIRHQNVNGSCLENEHCQFLLDVHNSERKEYHYVSRLRKDYVINVY